MPSRILVVEDVPANIQTLSATLKAKGYQVSVATSGKSALELLARLHPDLILLDVMMPEMDGFETCRRLKASEATRDIPVIFLTARSDTPDVVQGFESGAVDYVAKPFHPHELLARVQTHLTLDRLHRENERLLLSILPPSIANRLKSGEAGIADHYAEVSVLFADLVGFTSLSQDLSPGLLVSLLNDLFTEFDELARRRGVEKIKTIGDCYMAVCGMPERRPDHAAALADLALDLLACIEAFNRARGKALELRIGMNAGPVVAGVIGRDKFIYDLWGDTVNTASRMESAGVPNRIQIAENMQGLLAPLFEIEPRGQILVKGKGSLPTWFLLRRKS